MENSRIVLWKAGQGEYEEKKSRFIANIFPARTEEEAMGKIEEMKKKYYDARHNCYAYIVGDNKEIERCSDDGEPSGTAGRPMLEVLNGQGIHNVVVIVTRYFGGTLLGTGGLVKAYSEAVQEGLKSCAVLTEQVGYKLKAQTGYQGLGVLQYAARSLELVELDSVYTDIVEFILLVPLEKKKLAEEDIIEKTGGQATLEWMEKVRFAIRGGRYIEFVRLYEQPE